MQTSAPWHWLCPAAEKCDYITLAVWHMRWSNARKGVVKIPFKRVRDSKVLKDAYDLEDAPKASLLRAQSCAACCTPCRGARQAPPAHAPMQGRMTVECQWIPAFAAA